MKYILIVLALLVLVSCSQQNCDKAKADYAVAVKYYDSAKAIYNAAMPVMVAACAVVAQPVGKVDLAAICAKAKQAVDIANISLGLADAAKVAAAAVLASSCPVPAPVP